MSDLSHKPLSGDQSRQALEPWRGFSLQIWRSVFDWIRLKEDEVLFLEGAEDVDRLGPEGAETVQIKKSSGVISLASKYVLEAIVHYWLHRSENPSRAITYRFLTTASRTIEQGLPFLAVGGIDFWDQCRDDSADLAPLRQFLTERIPRLEREFKRRETKPNRAARTRWNQAVAELTDFIDRASDAELRETLIRRIIWDTGAEGEEAVVEHVYEAVQLYGDQRGIRPTESAKAVPHLLQHALAVVRRSKDRFLKRIDFVRIFERATAETIPREELNQLRRASARATGSGFAAEPQYAGWYADTLKGIYQEARIASNEGRLEEAEADLTRLLTSVREVAPANDPERNLFEQGLLLSLAQIDMRKDNLRSAAARLKEAELRGEFRGKNRHLAAWVAINLGRNKQALELLNVPDMDPSWRSTFGIALVAEGDLDQFVTLFGRDPEVDEPDLLLALTKHRAEREQALQAVKLAKRLLDMDDGSPEARFRAIEAAWSVLALSARADNHPPIDVSFWIRSLRRLFEDADQTTAGSIPLLRRLVLERRVEFLELLDERDAAAEQFRRLVEEAPEDAARLAAWGTIGLAPDGCEEVMCATRDPVETVILEITMQESDYAVAAAKLKEIEPIAEGPLRNLVIPMLLEVSAAAGADREDLVQRLDEITDPVLRALTHAAMVRRLDGPEAGLDVIESMLAAYPQSLRLLRAAHRHSQELTDLLAQSDSDISDAARHEVELAERLVDRFPAPEFRVGLAYSRVRAGDLEGALREVRMVVDAGYSSRRSLSLWSNLAGNLRRFSEHAEAARRLYELDCHPKLGLLAAQAALRARFYTDAELLLRKVIAESDERALQLRAYALLAFTVEAMEGAVPGARVKAVEVLLDGYDALGGPAELAAHLYLMSLGTRYSREVYERIIRDHGTFQDLPDLISVPVDEAVAIMRREQEGVELRSRMHRAGVLPFELFVDLGSRSAAYLWFSHRISRIIMMVDPYPYPMRIRQATIADEWPLLLERTALLMLAEIALIDPVLNSRLPLLIEAETYDWLDEEERRLQRDYRPIEHDRLRATVETIAANDRLERVSNRMVDKQQTADLESTLGWVDAHELALALRDNLIVVDDYIDREKIPEDHRDRYIRSVDLLRSLVAIRQVSYKVAVHAEEERPDIFAQEGWPGTVETNRSLLLASGTMQAWHDVGLLKVLAEAAPRTVMSPLAEQRLLESLTEQETYAIALKAISRLRERISDALESGRIRLVGIDISEKAKTARHDPAREQNDEEDLEGEITRDQARDFISGPVRRIYQQAADAKAIVWSDDAAIHLYRDPWGPMVLNAPDLAQLVAEVRTATPDVKVVTTLDVLDWLIRNGQLNESARLACLRDLIQHRRGFLCNDVLLAEGALRRGIPEGENQDQDAVLDFFGALPSLLDDGVTTRFLPRAMDAAASAFTKVWFAPDACDGDKRAALRRLVVSLSPWVRVGEQRARSAAQIFWTAMLPALAEYTGEARDLLNEILKVAAERVEELHPLLVELWSVISVLDRALSELPDGAQVAAAPMFNAIADAAAEIEVDGRPLVPVEMLRLAAPLFGLHLRWHRQFTTTGQEPATYSFDEQIGDDQAIAFLMDITRSHEENLEQLVRSAAGLQVRITARSEDGREIVVPFDVPYLRILDRLSPAARQVCVDSLIRFHTEKAESEIAACLVRHRDLLISADSTEFWAGYRDVLRQLLGLPRLWVEHDLYRAFLLLCDAPLRLLHEMGGSPEPWRAGESFADRTLRIRQEATTDEEVLRQVRQAWGPFGIAVLQWIAFASKQNYDAVDEATARDHLSLAASAGDPYGRTLSLTIALALLDERPDLRVLPLDILELEDGEEIQFSGSLAEFAVALLDGWLRAELGAVESESASELDGTDSVWGLVCRHKQEERLAVVISRLVSRAVLSPQHDMQASISAQRSTNGDAVGDLLLLIHLLVPPILGKALGQAQERSVESVLAEAERAAEQFPLSEHRVPLGDVFIPEAMAVGSDGVNPYMTLLLAILAAGWQAPTENANQDQSESGKNKIAAPFWWVPEIQESIQRIAASETPAPVRYLEEQAQRGGVTDRFGSLLTGGLQAQARAILERYGSAI